MSYLVTPTATSLFNLLGSTASVFGSLFVIVTHGLLGLKQDSVRTRLISSLAVADFLNALNQSLSGIAANLGWKLDGPWCTVNGFVGQWTVVASDVNIFIIAVATVMALNAPIRWHQNVFWLQRHYWALIVGVWAYGLATALTALLTFGYVKSAPNWCWISPTPQYARYVLTHGLRIAIIFSIMGMYTSVYLTLRKQAKVHSDSGVLGSPIAVRSDSGVLSSSVEVHSDSRLPAAPVATTSKSEVGEKESGVNVTFLAKDKRNAGLQRAMRMMIIFPTVYTILWIPGLINRFYNLFTNGGSNEILDFLQGLTQWIGFANGVAYGLNGEVAAGLKAMVRRRPSRQGKANIVVDVYAGR